MELSKDRKSEEKKAGRKKERKRFSSVLNIQGLIYNSSLDEVLKEQIQRWMIDNGCW
jgi:hypothetical protein